MLDVSAPPTTQLDAVFFALCDQTRRGLLGRLRGVELTAGALADGFHVTRPAVSRHLRILREARLVSERRRGRERVYTLTPEPLAGATGWLEDYRTFWAARLGDLKSLIESLPDDEDDEDDEDDAAASPAISSAPSRHRPVAPASSALRTSAAAPSASPVKSPSSALRTSAASSTSPLEPAASSASPAAPLPAVDLPASPAPLDPSRSRR